jgi:hypothetical protein
MDGTGLSGGLGDHWPWADVATSHWLASTPDCSALSAEGPVNYSRRRLEFSRAGSWPNRAPDCLVHTGLSSAT